MDNFKPLEERLINPGGSNRFGDKVHLTSLASGGFVLATADGNNKPNTDRTLVLNDDQALELARAITDVNEGAPLNPSGTKITILSGAAIVGLIFGIGALFGNYVFH